MNRQEAAKLISETFQNPFDEGRFRLFIRNLINGIEEEHNQRPITGNYIPDSFEKHISKYSRIGKYTDPDGNRIDVLIVHLKREAALDRARTAQRNFIARYLNGGRGGILRDAALVAFYTDDLRDWRFSLVRMDYRLEQTESGKVKVKSELTPARRYSFLVGKNEPNHTAQRQILPILQDDRNNPTLSELEKAFDIETVTKEFFVKYRDLFVRTKEGLDKVVENDAKIRTDFEAKGVNTIDFAKKLLGQITFLYFLQKKGWFGVGRDAGWGTGSKHFLQELFEKKHGDYKNFFNDIMEPLFYEALRIDRSHDDDYYSRFNCKIPFLNGGLFDPVGNYDWVHTDIHLPDTLFSNKNKTREGEEGDGILDIFDRYNFTVKEDEPLEKEVAIDPELLGKAYEKFNAIRPDNFDEYKKALKSGNKGEENKFNKQYGVYYTPREIVHYMCQQSLINYLYSAINDAPASYEKLGETQTLMFKDVDNKPQLDLTIEHRSHPVISKEGIEALIHYGERVSENEEIALIKEQKILEGKQKSSDYKLMLPEGIRENAKLIDQLLEDITVCDLAVGSGAFPVGMMSEIVKLRSVLPTFIKEENRTVYDFKRRCIEHSLYGVDIDPGAVEIAKLRLWLSLVVDEGDIKNIKPLPNLDYKIVCGNALLGVKRDLWNAQFFSELETLKPLYFNETNPTKKQEFKKQIDGLINKITKGHKEFDFEVYFSEVFHHKGGFDIVIANPPYVSYGLRGGQKMLTKEKEFLKRTYPNSAEYKISLYAVFMDKAMEICRQNGLQTLIVPDSFLLGRYFSKIRKFILRNNEIVSILLLPYGVFDATVGFSVVYLFQKKSNVQPSHKFTARFAENNKMVQDNTFKSFSYEQNFFNGLRHNRFRLFFDQGSMYLISKIEKNTAELGVIVKFSSGLIGKNGQDSLISDTKNGGKWLNGITSGGEINKYAIFPKGNYLLYDKELIKSGYESVDYFKEKLFMRQTGDSLICAYDKNGLLALNNVHIGNLIDGAYSLKVITAIINSRLLDYYYKKISLETGRAMAQTDIETVETLPIKRLTTVEQKPFIEIVDQILAAKQKDPQADTSSLEKQIDEMVYKLYDLTPEEIAVVEGGEIGGERGTATV